MLLILRQFSTEFCNFNVLSKFNIIVGSKNALLTNATEPHVSDVMSQAWFCSHFHLWLTVGWKMLASESWHFPSYFKLENGNVGPIVYSFPLRNLITGSCPHSSVP